MKEGTQWPTCRTRSARGVRGDAAEDHLVINRLIGFHLMETGTVFGDFVLDASIPVNAICESYALPAPPASQMEVGAWITSELGRTPIVGDQVSLGPATLVIRADTVLGRYMPSAPLPQERGKACGFRSRLNGAQRDACCGCNEFRSHRTGARGALHRARHVGACPVPGDPEAR